MASKRKAEDSNASANKKKKGDVEKEDKLLANLMQHHIGDNDAVSFEKCATDLDFMVRTKTWVAAWKGLLAQGFIEACAPGAALTTGNHKLTQEGIDHAATDEYKEHVKDLAIQPTTNEEHQARIKTKLMKKKEKGAQIGEKGAQIFDLLQEHGSLNRYEIAGIMGCKSGAHSFSYALKELRDTKIVEIDASRNKRGDQKLCLADKAFLTPGDRPDGEPTDPDEIAKLINVKKGGAGKKKKKRKATKVSDSDEQEQEEAVEEKSGIEEDAKDEKASTGASSDVDEDDD